jgi:type IV secretory pathway TraG/TraD family ATPase VirD4
LRLRQTKGEHSLKRIAIRLSQIIDEAALFMSRLSDAMATGRSNHISVTPALRDISQIRASYGKKQAYVILNLPANLIVRKLLVPNEKLPRKEFKF